jgi:hypothetical protein
VGLGALWELPLLLEWILPLLRRGVVEVGLSLLLEVALVLPCLLRGLLGLSVAELAQEPMFLLGIPQQVLPLLL